MSASPVRVLFACDAGAERGVGHVMRCVALAEEFAARGAQPVFVADLTPVPWAARQVSARGFAADHRAPYDATALLAHQPDLVVLDSYAAPPEMSVAVRAAGVPVLAIADGASRGQSGDLYLDQNLGAERDAWPGPGHLAGLRYALLRDDVRAVRPSRPRIDGAASVPEVFAYCGGTDPAGAAPVLARALAATGLRFRATVVAATSDLAAAIGRAPLLAGQHIAVTAPIDDLPARAARADLVLCASGTSVWEMLCVGAAAAITMVADNQATGYARAVATGAVAGLGDIAAIRDDPGPAVTELTALLTEPQRRAALRATGWSLVDGAGRERVADAATALEGAGR